MPKDVDSEKQSVTSESTCHTRDHPYENHRQTEYCDRLIDSKKCKILIIWCSNCSDYCHACEEEHDDDDDDDDS